MRNRYVVGGERGGVTKRPDTRPRAQDRPLRRGESIGQRLGGEPESEADHYMRCPACGGYFDMRDLGQVLEHEGPLPHPAQDKPQ